MVAFSIKFRCVLLNLLLILGILRYRICTEKPNLKLNSIEAASRSLDYLISVKHLLNIDSLIGPRILSDQLNQVIRHYKAMSINEFLYLQKLVNMAEYLVNSTLISLYNEDPDYFTG